MTQAGAGRDSFFRRVPRLFVLLGGLTTGIALSPFIPAAPAILWIAALLLLVAAILISPRAPAGLGIGLFAVAICLHGAAAARLAATPEPGDISRLAGGPSIWVRGRVVSDVEARTERGQTLWAATLAVESVDNGAEAEIASGHLQISARGSDPPAYGEQIQLRGRVEQPPPQTNPDGFDYRAFLARRGIHATLTARRAEDVQPIGAETANSLYGLVAALRNGLKHPIESCLSPEDAGLLESLLLGVRGGVPGSLSDAFARTGTVHLLTVSGLHIAAIAAILSAIFGRLPISHRWANALCLPVLWTFALVAGDGPAVYRAAMMASIMLAAPLVRRVPDPLHSWGVAALLALLVDPLALYEAGFQLSFVTVGILLLYLPALERHFLPWEPRMPAISRVSRWVLLGVLTSVVAAAGSWPLAAYHFNLVSPVATLANLIAAPLAEALLLLGLGTAALAALLPRFAIALSFPFWGLVHLGLGALRGSVLAFAAVPFAGVPVPSPPAGGIIVYYLALAALAIPLRRHLLRKPFEARRG